MYNRKFSAFCSLMGAIYSAAFVTLLPANYLAAGHPNIVIFLADDQGWGDLSVHGNQQLATPNIDSLARDGVRFDRFYVCPVCSPTRAEFLTGRYFPRTGVRGVSTGEERLNLDEQTIANHFTEAGYATGAFGKWHNGSQWPYHPNARGFTEYYGFTSGHWGEYFDPPLEYNGQWVRGKGFIADDLVSHALEFIDANHQRPFFCYVPFNTPHSPFAVPDEYWERHKNQPITQRGSDGQKETLDVTRCALAMCENIDSNVGRVLSRLEELKIADNTIVVYFSDNGPNSNRWNDAMRGRKGSTDEGGVRVPLLMRWPGKISAGKVVKQIAGAIDLMPTLQSLAGVTANHLRPMDGQDLTPVLMDAQEINWPDRKIFSHWNGKSSVRTQRYRLDSEGRLYDMTLDPGQTHEVTSKNPSIAQELRASVSEWETEMFSNGNRADRPYPVGYPEFPLTPLPARDGVPHGGVKRSSSAPNCSYFVHWTSLQDSITWDIDVATAGTYEVVLYYTAPLVDAGAEVSLDFAGSILKAKIVPGWDPPLFTNQDTIERPKAESQMKEFHPLLLGHIQLDAKRGLLTLRATDIPGQSVADVRMLTLRLIENRND